MAKVGFFVGHQDDELLTMGAGIANHIQNGHDVHVFVCTDGEGTGAINIINGSVYCQWHEKNHDPVAEGYASGSLSKEELGNFRDQEFYNSCQFLGVPHTNVHFQDVARKADGSLTVADAKAIIRKGIADHGLERIKAHSDYDTHSDHANIGKALRELVDSGEVTDGRFYSKRSNWESCPKNLGTEKPADTSYVVGAIGEYKKWNPKGETTGIDSYAIGYHSVPDSFDALQNDPVSKYHV